METIALLTLLAAVQEADRPAERVALFNGRDLSGWRTWLRDTKREDPSEVFSAVDGTIRCSGRGTGYLATEKAWRDYRLVVEYRWGEFTGGSKTVRNSGILVHAGGPDGGAGRGAWMASVEVQLAQGCVGDLIVIRGADVPVTLASETAKGADGRTRWSPGGTPTPYSGKQFWWSKHEAGFKELIDTRGKDDVESPLGEWTRVEVVARGNRLTVSVNGTTVNEAYDVAPSGGKILLQCEGFEVFFRTVELHPLEGGR